MRILELHSPYFRALWRRAGHEVLCWGPHPECDLQATAAAVSLDELLGALPSGWRPDLIVFGDDCRLLRAIGIEDAPCPTLLISVDAHHNAGWHAPLAAACDVACVAQRDYLETYVAAGASAVHWLPCWAPDDLPPPSPAKTFEVAFVGSLDPRLNPERVALMEALRPRLPLHVAEGVYAAVFGRSRIVLNQTVKGDLNARVFEAMACGALLVTERTGNGLLDLFRDGEHLVTYPRGDVEAIVAAVERWRGAERERAEVAECGFAEVRARHLESHRAAAVLAHAAAATARPPLGLRHAGAARAYCQLAHYATRLAARFPKERFYPAVRQRYLAAAEALAAGPHLAEPDRRAALGAVALERGHLARAAEHLAWVARSSGRVEDHVLYVEALLRAGNVAAARRAAAALAAAHPSYPMAAALAQSLGLLDGEAPPPTADLRSPGTLRA
jgi:hypothetical protein